MIFTYTFSLCVYIGIALCAYTGIEPSSKAHYKSIIYMYIKFNLG